MKKHEVSLNGFLDQGCVVRGDVEFSDLLRIHGHVIGKVTSQHELLVGEGGVVEGEICVGRLIVAGAVSGTVRVKEALVVHATGRVTAEVFTPSLVVDKGGVVDGTIHMANGERPPLPA